MVYIDMTEKNNLQNQSSVAQEQQNKNTCKSSEFENNIFNDSIEKNYWVFY